MAKLASAAEAKQQAKRAILVLRLFRLLQSWLIRKENRECWEGNHSGPLLLPLKWLDWLRDLHAIDGKALKAPISLLCRRM